MSEATTTRRVRENRQRRHLIQVRVDFDERATITEKAERAGMTVGAFARHQLIGSAGPRAARRPLVERQELARVLAALGRYGSNVNQLARAANGGAIPPSEEIAALVEATQDMRAMLMRALGATP